MRASDRWTSIEALLEEDGLGNLSNLVVENSEAYSLTTAPLTSLRSRKPFDLEGFFCNWTLYITQQVHVISQAGRR